MNLRVVYYARVSTESDEQLNSLDNQSKFFDDYIKNSKNWILVGKYIDEGISATSVKGRKSFAKMIEDGVNGKFDMIITKEVSRFARNTIDSIKYTDYLLKHGVIVNFLNDNLNTIDETCEFRLTIMSSLAQDEVRKLSSRVKFGLARSVKDGKVLGGGNITGYYKEKGRLYIDEKEAPMIRMLFDLYSSGKYGFRKISDILYSKGYKNSKGKKYAERVLSRLLQNPKYKGYYCGNMTYIEDYKTHKKIKRPKEEWILYKDENIPAIVDEEVWNKANELYLSKRNQSIKLQGKRNYYEDKYTYTSKLICTEHLCHFTRHSSGARKTNPVWQCLEYHRGGLKACQTPTLFEKHLDKIFKDIIYKFVDNKDKLLKVMVEDYKKFILENNNSINKEELERKNKRLGDLKNKLLELNLDGCITNSEFKEKNEMYNKEILENKKLIEKESNSNNEEYLKNINILEEQIRKKLSFKESYKSLFDILVKEIYVSKINNNRKNILLELRFNVNLEPITINHDFKSHITDTLGSRR